MLESNRVETFDIRREIVEYSLQKIDGENAWCCWLDHLGTTLFSEGKWDTWYDLRNVMLRGHGQQFSAWGCKSKSSRSLVFACECGRAVKGGYSTWDSANDRQHLRDALSIFVLGKKTNAANL